MVAEGEAAGATNAVGAMASGMSVEFAPEARCREVCYERTEADNRKFGLMLHCLSQPQGICKICVQARTLTFAAS